MTEGVAGREDDESSILNALLAILGLYQDIVSAIVQVWRFSNQLEIIYETLIMPCIKTEFRGGQMA